MIDSIGAAWWAIWATYKRPKPKVVSSYDQQKVSFCIVCSAPVGSARGKRQYCRTCIYDRRVGGKENR